LTINDFMSHTLYSWGLVKWKSFELLKLSFSEKYI